MASDYGLNFGFLRSDESVRTADGRHSLPATGTFLQGSMVEIDPANAGKLKQGALNAAHIPGFSGLLVQELDHDRSIYQSPASQLDSFDLGVAKNGKLAVISGGVGVKFFLRNTAAQTRADGRAIAARTVITIASVAVGDSLSWTGSLWVETGTASTTVAIAKVTAVDSTLARVEAVLL